MIGFFVWLFFLTLFVNLLASNETSLDTNNNIKGMVKQIKFKNLQITDVDSKDTITVSVENERLPKEDSFYNDKTDSLYPEQYLKQYPKQPVDDSYASEEYILAPEQFADDSNDSEQYFVAPEQFSDDSENSKKSYEPVYSDGGLISYNKEKAKKKTKKAKKAEKSAKKKRFFIF